MSRNEGWCVLGRRKQRAHGQPRKCRRAEGTGQRRAASGWECVKSDAVARGSPGPELLEASERAAPPSRRRHTPTPRRPCVAGAGEEAQERGLGSAHTVPPRGTSATGLAGQPTSPAHAWFPPLLWNECLTMCLKGYVDTRSFFHTPRARKGIPERRTNFSL